MNKILILIFGLLLVFFAASCNDIIPVEECKKEKCGERLRACFQAVALKDVSTPASNKEPYAAVDGAIACSFIDGFCKADCKFKNPIYYSSL